MMQTKITFNVKDSDTAAANFGKGLKGKRTKSTHLQSREYNQSNFKLTFEEELSNSYKNNIHFHPRIRPGWCAVIFSCLVLFTGASLMIAITESINKYRDKLPTSTIRSISISMLAAGGALLFLALAYTYYKFIIVQQILSTAKAKQTIIQKHLSLRSQTIFENHYKERYGYRGYFHDVTQACLPVHRFELLYDEPSDSEENVMDTVSLANSLGAVSDRKSKLFRQKSGMLINLLRKKERASVITSADGKLDV